MGVNKLTAQKRKFCQEYILDLNGTQAAIRAGYSTNTANEQAARLLASVSVQAEIARLQSKREARTEIKADMVLKELALIGFSDLANYLDVNAAGLVKVKDLSTLLPGQSKAIRKIKQWTSIKYDSGGGGGKIQDAKLEIELYDKLSALEKIGNHLGMFKNAEAEDIERSLESIADAISGLDQVAE